MLDVSDEVRAEIGDEEADRLLAGDGAPDTYDCTSCRSPGDAARERTSTVLFVGEETAVLAFAHAACVASQVVQVTEEQLRGAVRSIAGREAEQAAAVPAGVPAPAGPPPAPVSIPVVSPPPGAAAPPRPGVLNITCGLVLCEGTSRPALVVEPSGPVVRPGSTGGADEFLPLLIEHGFTPVHDVERAPTELPAWSVLLAMGKLHAVLQPDPRGAGQTTWWQAHQPLQVSETWRETANRTNRVLVYAAPVGAIGRQPREDLLREAMERAAEQGVLLGAVMPLTGT
ncbi:hypothetical protein [Streptomyces capparidis]